MAAPKYRIQVWTMTGASFAKGTLVAEFQSAKNIGYADYLNDVGEAFFTLTQDDPKLADLRPYRYNAHVLVYRDDVLVWGGFLGEWEATERDVIVYAYSYIGLSHLIATGWNVAYSASQVNTIVSDTFALGLGAGKLSGWITSGTIEAPVTASGGATPIVMPSYRMFYKRILQVYREMAAFSIGNTTNTVVFEVTPAGVFNFWKNRGVDRSLTWAYGDRKVKGFAEGFVPLSRRNNLLAAGMNPSDSLMRSQITNAADVTAKGQRDEPVFFSWVRDSTELARVAALRAAQSIRDDNDLTIQFYPNSVVPIQAQGGALRLSDRVLIDIRRGITQFNGLKMILGCQVLFVGGQERVSVRITDRPGT